MAVDSIVSPFWPLIIVPLQPGGESTQNVVAAAEAGRSTAQTLVAMITIPRIGAVFWKRVGPWENLCGCDLLAARGVSFPACAPSPSP
jgi:hypothetical protein